jgi:hypothetical protein
MSSCLLLLAALLLPACGSSDSGGDPPDADLSDARQTPLAFMDPCNLDNDQCDTAAGDYCFNFTMKGPHCTHDCGGPEDCPSPSTGCNGMNVCKAP